MRFITYFATLLFAIFLTACGGGGGSPGLPSVVKTPITTTAASAITVGAKTAQTFVIAGGTAPFQISSSNVQVATASVDSRNFTVAGWVLGTATITISDASQQKATIEVTVADFSPTFYTAAPASFTVAISTPRSFVLGGGVPGYAADSTDARIADATVSAGKLLVTGKSVGTTTVVVRDSASPAATVTLTVTVGGDSLLGLYTSAPSSLTVPKGTTTSYSIGGGVPGYTVVSADSRIAAVSRAGTDMIINAVAFGTTTVIVRDSAGASLTVNVTVAASSPDKLFTSAPTSVFMTTGTSQSYLVSGGTLPYYANSADQRVATIGISGSTVIISALTAGTTAMQILDAAGAVLQIAVTVDGASGTAGVASIDILASSSTLASAPGSSVSFIVTAKDSVNAAIPQLPITFTATSGTLSGANPVPVTNASGTVSSVSLSPGADQSIRNITVTAFAGGVSKSIVIPVVGTTLSISGAGSALVGTSALTYSIKALDSGGKPIVGAVLAVASAKGNTIAPASVVTDAAGAATFSFTPIVAGTDTLTVTGLGTSKTASVAVSNEDFAFTAPLATDKLVVNTVNTVTVRYKLGGVGVAGKTVTFSTTRGSLSTATAITNTSGDASTTVSSSTAGPVTLSAQLDTARSSVTAAFIATTPANIVLQANPGAVLPNSTGSTLTATVRDATGNPVSNQVVNFTAIQDGSNGSIVPGSGTTDANGMTSVQFVPGALSTAANGVVIQAAVQSNPSLSSTATLTVNGNALFIAIGVASTLTPLDAVTYQKQFSVYVTDATGAAAANRAVTISVYPTAYGKGYLVWIPADSVWTYSTTAIQPTSSLACVNEDINRNGILDTSGSSEDINTNGKLDPGLPVIISPSSVTTDASGNATFYMSYGKNYAWWLSTQITARASVSGTESTQTTSYALEMLATDAKSESSPANQTSPFGTATVCTNPN